MLNSSKLDVAQAQYDRLADTEKYLRRNGGSLCSLFEVLDAPIGFDALCELHQQLARMRPDADAIRGALAEIEKALANQTISSTDLVGSERQFEASEAVRWHGARISEFHARFCDAE